jgi:hypothetical protein
VARAGSSRELSRVRTDDLATSPPSLRSGNARQGADEWAHGRRRRPAATVSRLGIPCPVRRRGEVMNIVLWVLQVVLAVAFFAHGWLFLAPPPEIAELMDASLPRWFQLFLGVAEILAAQGSRSPVSPGSCRARDVGRRRNRHRDGVGDAVSHRERRDELGRNHHGAARHGDVRGVHATSCRAHSRPARLQHQHSMRARARGRSAAQHGTPVTSFTPGR